MIELTYLENLAFALSVEPRELISLVGGGGKTTALFALTRQLGPAVIATTTTKMGSERTDGVPLLLSPSDSDLLDAIARSGRVLVWQDDDGRRATGVGPGVADRWFDLVDHVVVEADGSRRRPFKAPLSREPVMPSRTTLLVGCVGTGAFGQPINECCHRPDRVADVAGCAVDDRLTADRLARVLLSDEGSLKGRPSHARFAVLVNRVGAEHHGYLNELVAAIDGEAPVVAVARFSTDDSPALA